MIIARLLSSIRTLFSFSGLFLFFTLRWLIRPIGVLTMIGLVIGLPLTYFSRSLLTVEKPIKQADWIVVLGGESSQRVIGTAELFHAGKAPYVFVSGSGDCLVIVRRLVMTGVPMSKIGYECRSRNTKENALLTRYMLNHLQPKRILLVTSWYHSRRALATFQDTWPNIDYGMHVTYPGTSLKDYPSFYESGFAFAEYMKLLKYKIGF